jgi:peptidoglycan-N-acetylglucosamine deacetylase
VRAVRAAGGLAALTGAGLLLFPPPRVLALAARTRRDLVFSVDTSEPVVALSLDDGPHPEVTARVLDTLSRHGAQATFFFIGERAQAGRALRDRLFAGGHEVGNHLWRERRSASLSDAEFDDELVRTDAALAGLPRAPLLRPGSGYVGRRLTAIAERRGFRCVLGSVYPHDPVIRSRRFAARYVLRRSRPGAIIVLHEGDASRAWVVDVLEEVLPELRRRGLRVTSIGRLIRQAEDG